MNISKITGPASTWLLAFAIPLIYSALVAIPYTREFGVALGVENSLIELLTFFFFIYASYRCFNVFNMLRSRNQIILIRIFLIFLGIMSFLVAMEEISWGQWFLGFETPERLSELNSQGETNFHNISIHPAQNLYLRFAFATCGFFGFLFYLTPRLKIIAPSVKILPWLIVITILASIEWWSDNNWFSDTINPFLSWKLPEVTELEISLCITYYIHHLRLKLTTPKI